MKDRNKNYSSLRTSGHRKGAVMKRFQVLLIAIAIISLAINPLLVAAQSPQSSILFGLVSDDQGTPLPGAKATVSSPSLQGTRMGSTGDNGQFSISGLTAGTYKLTVELEGFRTDVREIAIHPGSNSVAVTLQIAEVAEEMIVTGQLQSISGTPDIYAVDTYNPETTKDLPVTRNLAEAINLTPGTVTDVDYNPQYKSFGAATNSGAFFYDNLFLINGVEVNENIRGTFLPLFIEDAIVETTSITSGVSAEYGRFTGGVVNAITKSGGNELSGSFEVNLDNDWHYAPSDINAGQMPDISEEAYEATFDGPVLKDRLWFFLAGRDGGSLAMSDDPSSGELKTVAEFPFADNVVGFDIAPNGSAYAALTFPGQNYSWLYKVNLSTGDTDRIGKIGGGDKGPVDFLTVVGTANDVQCSVDTVSSTGPLNGSHAFTATVTAGGEAVPPGTPVSVEISKGPNQGFTRTGMTDDKGQVKVSYTNSGGQKGTDMIVVRGNFLGQEFSCTVRQIWTDLPVITGATIKPNLNKVVINGFNFFGWNLEATINGQSVKFRVKSDKKAVAKKTRAAIGDCDGTQVIEIFADGFESGDTSSWSATCP